jgi:hypothetical protein
VRICLRGASVLFVLALFAPAVRSSPLHAARTGLACQQCHFDANGGGPRTAFGFAYAKNRHATEPEPGGMFKDVELSNRVGEKLPLYFGVEQRFLVLAEDQSGEAGLDRFGFHNTETSLELTFQPHERLTLVYTSDGSDSQPRVTRDAWGRIDVGNNYLRAGQFRVPFGLHMDDHSVASRNGFLDFQGGGSALPYDARVPDQGIEVGGTHGPHYGRFAFTNGTSNVLGSTRTHAQAVSGKIGYSGKSIQDGYSGYDEWVPARAAGDRTRASRWGWYGLAHRGAWSLIGEVIAGTDRFSQGGGQPERSVNRLGWFAESDYQLNRGLNLRARYDRLETDRSSNPAVREANSFNRYALEGEVVPMPFAELRWALRTIDPTSERQALLELHFAY